MKMNEKIQKNIERGILLGLICAVVLSFAGFDSACDNLRSNVLRLHILANSDTDEDQAVKLKIRDEILKKTDIFNTCIDLSSAVSAAEQKTDEIEKIARKVLRDEGFDYSVSVCVGDSYFDTREYEDFTLPAGNYKSLIVKLGKARGHNWWCVLFPAVCVPTATDAKLSDSASQKSSKIAENPQKYEMRFKTVEWYENIRHKIKQITK